MTDPSRPQLRRQEKAEVPIGRYFEIRSKLNGLVLGVAGEDDPVSPGTHVVMCEEDKDEGRRRLRGLWYEDRLTGTIRSRMGKELCLDVDESNVMVVNPYKQGRTEQQLMTTGDVVQSQDDSERVVAADGDNPEPGTGVSMCRYVIADITQKWEFVYTSARYCHIRSAMNDKVLQCLKSDKKVGVTNVFTWRRQDNPSTADMQLWYLDKHGVIHAKVNNLVFDSSSPKKIHLEYLEVGKPEQLWTFSGGRIVNTTRPTHVIAIRQAKNEDGAKLTSTKYTGAVNQQWLLDFLDEEDSH